MEINYEALFTSYFLISYICLKTMTFLLILSMIFDFRSYLSDINPFWTGFLHNTLLIWLERNFNLKEHKEVEDLGRAYVIYCVFTFLIFMFWFFVAFYIVNLDVEKGKKND